HRGSLASDQDVVDRRFHEARGVRVGGLDDDAHRLPGEGGEVGGGGGPGGVAVGGRAGLFHHGRRRRAAHSYPEVVGGGGGAAVREIPRERQPQRALRRERDLRRPGGGDASVDVVRARVRSRERAGDQGVDAARGGAELLGAEVVRVLRVAAFPLAGGGGVGAVGVRGPAGGGLEVVGPDGLGPFGGGEGPDGVRDGVGVAV